MVVQTINSIGLCEIWLLTHALIQRLLRSEVPYLFS